MTLPFVDADTDVRVSHKDQMNPNLLMQKLSLNMKQWQISPWRRAGLCSPAIYRRLGLVRGRARDVAGRCHSEIAVAVTGEQIVEVLLTDDYQMKSSLVIPGIVRDFDSATDPKLQGRMLEKP